MSIHDRAPKFGPGVSMAVVLIVGSAGAWGPVRAAGKWTNHVDASFIKCIAQRGGELVMATNGGLLVFSPQTGRFMQFGVAAGLPSNRLTSIAFDATDQTWIGTEDVGLVVVRIDAGGINVQNALDQQIDGLAGDAVSDVDVWDDRIVYGTQTGAGLIENGVPAAVFSSRNGLPSDVVNDVMVDGNFVWMATDSGVVALDRLGFIRSPAGGPSEGTALARTADAVWVGTADGAWRMSLADSSWTSPGPVGRAVRSLYWDGSLLWAGADFTLHSYDGATWTTVFLDSLFSRYKIAQPSGRVQAISRTPAGDVYLGVGIPSQRRGLNLVRFRSGQATSLQPNTPSGNEVGRLAMDIDGSLWISAMNFGVGKLTPTGKWVNYNSSIPEADSLSNIFANLTLLADLDGSKWFSTLSLPPSFVRPLDELSEGLDDDYSNDAWTRHAEGSGGGDGLGTLRPQRAVLDPAGNRWFLSDDEDYTPAGWRGIHVLSRDKSEWLRIDPVVAPSMIAGNVRHVVFRGTVAFIAYKTGVQSWDTGAGFEFSALRDFTDDIWGVQLFGRIGVEIPLPDADVQALAARSDGVVWIATTGGVARYAPGVGFSVIGAKTPFGVGLLSPKVNFLLLDRDENLWVATELGLNRIDREDENDIEAFTTAAAYQAGLNKLLYPFSIISPLADANCRELLLHPARDDLFIATNGGLSVLDITPAAETVTDLSGVYLYPNPIDGTKGHTGLKIDNVTSPLSIRVYTIEGDLVHAQDVMGAGDVVWDLTTIGGFVAASGVYLVRISNGSTSTVRRVALIR